MQPFVILDRDGVINEDSPDYIKSPEEWIPIAGSLEAIALLNQHGFDVYVATNQAGIARGKFSEATLQQIHRKMFSLIEAAGGKIKALRFCPHHPDARCDCRKPKPGMLLHLAREQGLNLAQAAFVGDALTDLEAAEAAGCTPILVLTGVGQQTRLLRPQHQPVFPDLLSYVQQLVETQGGHDVSP